MIDVIRPQIKLTKVEATCPHCNTEIEVELPNNVFYKNPDFAEDDYFKFISLGSSRTDIKSKIAVLSDVEHKLQGWRNGKARRIVQKEIIDLGMVLHDMDHEHYILYDKFNPSVGEMSTELP